MNLCIMGDSWGSRHVVDRLPDESMDEYRKKQSIITQLLEYKGHSVVNIAEGGASNFGQLKKLRYNVLEKKLVDFDYIIWFHTEPARDFTEFITLEYSCEGNTKLDRKNQFPNLSFKHFFNDINYLKIQNFKYAQDLYDRLKIPFILIGGAGLIGNIPDKFNFVHWKLNSWNQELCGLEVMPTNCYTHHVLRMIEYGNYDRVESLEEIKNIEKLTTIMHNNMELYSDKHHPSINLYKDIIDQILTHL